MDPEQVKRWLPAGAAIAVVAVVVIAGVLQSGSEGASSASSLPPSSAPTSNVTLNATPADAGSTVPTTIVKVPIAAPLAKGSAGDDVKRVQQRLLDLGFNPGGVDGSFGGGTQQAVWAFEKLVLGTPRAQATGVVTPAMWDRMQDQVDVVPRRPSAGPDHVEVYLPEQAMVIFKSGRPALIAHVSTGKLDPAGNPEYYCEDAKFDTDAKGNPIDPPRTGKACAYSKTPGGVFKISRMVQGARHGPLGSMMNPAYFNYGIAIHGADNVPLEPISHGCVRINQTLATMFQGLLTVGEPVLVWNGVKEPEDVTHDESLPSFDARTYDTTTTTTSTTTTTTTTTLPGQPVVPTTVPAVTTTTKVASTTTTVAPTTVAPTTVAPTTAAPTTVAPTTAAPTTTVVTPPASQPH